MVGKSEKIAFAKRACEFLLEKGVGKRIATQLILAKLEIPEIYHNTARSLLHRLADTAVLERSGSKAKYYWALAKEDYDKDNPLAEYYRNPNKYNQWNRNQQQQPEILQPVDVVTVKDKNDNAQQQLDSGTLTLLLQEVQALKTKIEELEAATPRELVIKINEKVVKTKDRVHPIYESVMFHIAAGDNVMLVGPKGCGKTLLASMVAKALKIKFGSLSLSGGVTESKLFGRVTPDITTGKQRYHAALFATMFEKGGCFLLDEVDAADPNVVIALNSALANGWFSLDRDEDPTVTKHKDFVCIAAANTWGNGADRQYVGRNQQDSAFTERFVQLAMDYDKPLELALCPGKEGWVRKMHDYRERIASNRLERTLSTRFIVRAYNWLTLGKGEDFCDEMLFAGWRKDEINKVKGGV